MEINNIVNHLLNIFEIQRQELTLLDLNLLLYDSWVHFYNLTDTYLFDEQFVSGAHGPVLLSIAEKFQMEMDKVIVRNEEIYPIKDTRVEVAMNMAAEQYLNNMEDSRKNLRRTAIHMVKNMERIPWNVVVDNDCYDIKNGVIVQVESYFNNGKSEHLYFKVPNAGFDIEAGIEKAVKDFSKSKKGEEFFYMFPTFTWGDIAFLNALDDFLFEHHIKRVAPFAEHLHVSMSKVLFKP